MSLEPHKRGAIKPTFSSSTSDEFTDSRKAQYQLVMRLIREPMNQALNLADDTNSDAPMHCPIIEPKSPIVPAT